MKILLLSEFFPVEDGGEITGGCETRTYYLAKQLAKSGHEVTVLTANLPGTGRNDNWSGIKVIRIGPKYSYVQSGSDLSRLLFALSLIPNGLKTDFEVVDANNTAVYVASFLIARLKRKKLVYWVPDILGFRGWVKALGLINGSVNFVNEWLGFTIRADNYIALSEMTREKLEKKGIKASKISVIYPGIEVISNNKKLNPIKEIISVNRLVGYKHNDTVIKAISELKKRGIILAYKIVGDGPQKSKLEKLAENLGVKNQVRFLGNLPHEEVLKQMAQSQIFCLPSAIEGFGIVTLEAAGCGLPFVNSDIPVNQEIAQKSQAGLLFKTGDPRDLADKLEELVKDKNKYQKLKERATRFAGANTLETAAGETLRVYAKEI